MVKVVAPLFDLDECANEREKQFIELLHARAEVGGWSADAWPRDDRIILTTDIADQEYNCVLRLLRIDFDGSGVVFGPDETYQLVTDLNPSLPGVRMLRDRPVAELVTVAADWLENEMNRPVVRQEWNRPGFRHRRWIFAETGKGLVWSDSANDPRREDLGPPDRIVPVSP